MMRNMCLWVTLVLVVSLPSIGALYLTNDTDIDAIDEILVEEDSLTIADLRFETAPTVPELRELLASPDRVKELPPLQGVRAHSVKLTKIYIWDLLGVYVYKETFLEASKPSPISGHVPPQYGPSFSDAPMMEKTDTRMEKTDTRVVAIAVDFTQMSEEYSPRHPFAGRIVVRDHALSETTTEGDLTAAGFRCSASNVYSLTIGKIELHVELESTAIPQTVASVRIITTGLPDTPAPTVTPKPTPTLAPTTNPSQCLSSKIMWNWTRISNDTAEIYATVSVDNNCIDTIRDVSCYAAMDAEATGRVWDKDTTKAVDIPPYGTYRFLFGFTCPMYAWTRVVTRIRVSGSTVRWSEGDWFRTD